MARAADPMKKVIKATLTLATEKGWTALTLADIAAAAKVPLGDLRGLVRDKAQILERFAEQIDADVLKSLEPELAEEPVRDRLFEVIMRRFEILAPHKDAIRRIDEDLRSSALDRLALAGPGLRSMEWMLAGAGIETSGLKGAVQVHGLALVYVQVSRTWLKDDDPGLARTMADLDSRLRRGEGWLKRAEGPIGLARTLGQFACNYSKARKRAAQNAEPEPST